MGDATGGDRRTGGEEGFRRDLKDSNEKKIGGGTQEGKVIKSKMKNGVGVTHSSTT